MDKALQQFVADQLVGMLSSPHYPCPGARGAAHNGRIRFGLYDCGRDITQASFGRLKTDFGAFVAELPTPVTEPCSFVASFTLSSLSHEIDFEDWLWGVLYILSDDDHELSMAVDSARVKYYEFKSSGREFFVVGMHAHASRYARRFAYPTIVFNPLELFQQIRASGTMESFMSASRTLDTKLQGCPNPNLDLPNEAQYSGRPVDIGWQRPINWREMPGGTIECLELR